MPIYEFKCVGCGHVFELLKLKKEEQKAADKQIKADEKKIKNDQKEAEELIKEEEKQEGEKK